MNTKMEKWAEKIRCGETSTLQFKRDEVHNGSLASELVAFANSKGGTMLFGVEDKKGTIEGLTYEEVQRISNQVGSVANSMVHPTIYVQTETLTVDDKIVLAVHVEEGCSKPYKDSTGSIWVKQGADKRHITENAEILRLYSESKKYYPDEDGVSGSTIEDLDDKKIDAYLLKVYGKQRTDFGVPFEVLMHNMHITTHSGELTLGGLLYFGKHPQTFKPNFCIKAVAFFGNEIGGTEYRDSRDIMGTIPEMFDEAMRFLNGNLHHVQAGQSFNSVGVLEISRVALEELIQNALCHREYIRQAAIRILIFDNRVEIVSPGALPEGMTVEEIKMGNTAQRNPLICTFCARTMIYRGLGSGIIRAMQDVKDIEFLNQGNQFTIVIKRKVFATAKYELLTNEDECQGVSEYCQGVDDESQGVGYKSQGVSVKYQGVSYKSQGVDNKSQGVNVKYQGVRSESQGVDKKSQGVDGSCRGVDGDKKIEQKQNAIIAFCGEPRSLQEIADLLGFADKYRFKKKYIDPILGKKIFLTEPNSPNSPTQKYVKGGL